jgi:hypothetical protein
MQHQHASSRHSVHCTMQAGCNVNGGGACTLLRAHCLQSVHRGYSGPELLGSAGEGRQRLLCTQFSHKTCLALCMQYQA